MTIQLEWSKNRQQTLQQLEAKLRKIAKPVHDVTIADLVASSESGACGLYFFLEGANWMYVGKASSRAIIERVPAHFDSRSGSWFGTLLKRLAEQSAGRKPHDVLPRALKMKLAVLTTDDTSLDLQYAETRFRHRLGPCLNSPKDPNPMEWSSRLQEMERPRPPKRKTRPKRT